MEYMLVLQLSGSSADDFDELIELEDAVREKIGEFGTVDGHDIGSGERNIFLYTEQPVAGFERIKSVFEARSLMHELRVAYREVGADEFTIIYPTDLSSFSIA